MHVHVGQVSVEEAVSVLAVLAVQAGAGEWLAYLPTKPGRGLVGSPFLPMYHLILNCLGFLMAWSLGSKGRRPQKAKEKLHGFG